MLCKRIINGSMYESEKRIGFSTLWRDWIRIGTPVISTAMAMSI